MNTFTVDIADAALDDLRVRLERTRFARPTPGPAGQAGISPDYLRELVDYWLRRFEAVRGIHDTHAVFAPRDDLRSEEEREFYRWFDAQWDGTMGYAGAGNARHDTIAASLADSPDGMD